MDPQEDPARDARALFGTLLERLQAHPALVREWEQALQEFPGAAAPGAARARALEWFLLERPSLTQGVPPAVAWAPEEFAEESAWARLLDNFLGIFRLDPGVEAGAGRRALVDLWSGRTAVVPDVELPRAFDAESLAVGRLVLGEDGLHRPLPGCFHLRARGLPAAMEADLGRARAAEPRGRLSQRECEALFGPWLEARAAEDPMDLEEVEARLGELLDGLPGWDLPRLVRLVEEEGATGAMNEMAFDTDVDLEQLRGLLGRWVALQRFRRSRIAALQREEGTRRQKPAPPGPGRILSGEEALARFDEARARGLPLDECFARLEADLGLEPGSSADLADAALEGAPIAERPPDFGLWIETYAFERAAEGCPLRPTETASLEAFGRFLERAAPEARELRRLTPDRVLAFLLGAPEGASLELLADELRAFLEWAAREQEAPVGELLASWEEDWKPRILALAELNRRLGEEPAEAPSRARIAGLRPLTVEASGETAEVDGVPEELAAWLRPGDLLLGTWRGGRFLPRHVLPREVLPPGSAAAGS